MRTLTKKEQKRFEENFLKAGEFFLAMKARCSCRNINSGYDKEPLPNKKGNPDMMLRAGFNLSHMCGD